MGGTREACVLSCGFLKKNINTRVQSRRWVDSLSPGFQGGSKRRSSEQELILASYSHDPRCTRRPRIQPSPLISCRFRQPAPAESSYEDSVIDRGLAFDAADQALQANYSAKLQTHLSDPKYADAKRCYVAALDGLGGAKKARQQNVQAVTPPCYCHTSACCWSRLTRALLPCGCGLSSDRQCARRHRMPRHPACYDSNANCWSPGSCSRLGSSCISCNGAVDLLW